MKTNIQQGKHVELQCTHIAQIYKMCLTFENTTTTTICNNENDKILKNPK